MKDHVNLNIENYIAIITLNRPELHNALSRAMIDDLNTIIDKLSNDHEIRAVIIHGNGDKAFCAGADLKERQSLSDAETLSFVEYIQASFQKIATMPMPTIASINGHAFGGGLELALACDIRMLNDKALLGLTECSLGIIPGAGGTQRLPKIVGLAKAMEMIFLAKRINASEALAIGLVNTLAPNAQETLMMAKHMAHIIKAQAPKAIRAAKEALLISQERNLPDGLVGELASYHAILGTMDRKEGLSAFLAKRQPQFSGS
jgi:enoyl-CoA hydratase/carnithine racemase